MTGRRVPGLRLRWVAWMAAVLLVATVVFAAGGSGNGRIVRGLPVVKAPPVPATLTITPSTSTGHLQDPVTVDVRVADATGRPVPKAVVAFRVVGANSGVVGGCEPADCRTDLDGDTRFRYIGTGLGLDAVTAQVADRPVFAVADLIWAPSVRGARFVVLGDSYSAGEGIGGYLPGTDADGVNSCHRSSLSFGELIQAGKGGSSFAFRACSGAVTDDLFSPNGAGNELADGSREPAQLCVECAGQQPAAVGPDTRAVALTIGGNDAGFSAVLAACVWVSELNFNYGRPGRGCSGQGSITDPVAARISALAGASAAPVDAPDGRPVHSLGQILEQIHSLAPDAQVYLMGYPRLFQPGRGDCYLGRVGISYAGRTVSVATKVTSADARWMDSVADLLDGVGRAAATAAGPWATFVDVSSAFADHGLCTGSSWINGVAGSLTVQSTHDVRAAIDPGSFHPSTQGQQAFAQALHEVGL